MKKTVKLTAILVLFIVPFMTFVSCGGDDDSPQEKIIETIKLSQNKDVIMEVGSTKEVTIIEGNGEYNVTTNKPNIAVAGISNNKIIITAKSEGDATISITDRKGKTASLNIEVTATPIIYNTYIELTTDMNIGDKITFNLFDTANVWIDLNNNGVKDKREGYITYGEADYILGSKTIRIHGKVAYFGCKDINLTNLDVSNNKYLTELDCTSNSSLSCIKVSPKQLNNIPSNWKKDDTTTYSTDCN